MIGVDSNVLVRFLVGDDVQQSALASRVFSAASPADPVFIPVVVLVESWWVLRRAYEVPPADIIDAFERLGLSGAAQIESADVVRRALSQARTGADFADAVIAGAARHNGCKVLTFDKKAARLAGMLLLEGESPRTRE